MRCDICDLKIEDNRCERIKSPDFKQAVDQGFHPFLYPDIEERIKEMFNEIKSKTEEALGLSLPWLSFSAWRFFFCTRWQLAASLIEKDWLLCERCFRRFQEFKMIVKPWKFVPYDVPINPGRED